jgi:hypothetical protein
MRLPIFESVRAPARFGALAGMALAVAGALAFDRMHLERAKRRAAALALMAAIVGDGSIRGLPLPRVPDLWAPERAAAYAAVLELPLGGVYDDVAAMYRAMAHDRPVMNGNSGFEPPHYFALRTALEERDPTALDALTLAGPLLIVVDKRKDRDGTLQAYAASLPRVTPLVDDGTRGFFSAAPAAPPVAVCRGDRLPIRPVAGDRPSVDLLALRDGDPRTWWQTGHPQQPGDSLLVDLGRVARPCAVTLAVGEFRKSYARQLSVETSVDGVGWRHDSTARMAGLTVRAALDDPINVAVSLPLGAQDARFIRLRIEEAAEVPWIVVDVSVTGAGRLE